VRARVLRFLLIDVCEWDGPGDVRHVFVKRSMGGGLRCLDSVASSLVQTVDEWKGDGWE